MEMFAITLAARQTPESRFSHFEGTEQELLNLVRATWENEPHRLLPGYRDGVTRMMVDPERFKSGIVKLEPGTPLVGEYSSRAEGEQPRKWLAAQGEKIPAGYVEIILYREDVLALTEGYEPAAKWEIISVNASPDKGTCPIPPMTLIYNHFGMDGGTPTDIGAEEFEAMLHESVEWWRDKALCGGE